MVLWVEYLSDARCYCTNQGSNTTDYVDNNFPNVHIKAERLDGKDYSLVNE